MKALQAIRGFFGGRQRSVSSAWVTLMGGGDTNASALAKPYARSAWVHAAIGHISKPISGLPLMITEDRRGGDVVLEDPALTAFWERPAVNRGGRMSRTDFIMATAGWLLLRGEAFWILDDTWLARGASKSPIILARPTDMVEITGGGGRELLGWSWMDGSGARHQLIPDQVLQLKCWNPYDDFRGLADWEAAAIAADADYAAGVFARNLSRNNGDRGPYVIGKNGQASDEQIKQITAQLRQKREMAARGDFRTVFLTGDIEVKEPSLQAVDTAYVAQRLENRKEVFAAFGVPMSFADPQASYSIGSASDRFRLIEDACMPLAAKIADGMEIISARLLGGGRTVFVEFDWDEHSTMQQVRGERFEIATKAVDRGMPWHEASEYFRLSLPRFAGDHVGRIPFNLQEIAPVEMPEDPEAPMAESDPVEDLQTLFARRAQEPCKACAGGAQHRANEEWNSIHAKRRPWEKQYTTKARRLIMDARSETLRNIADVEAVLEKSAVLKWGATDLIFNLGKWLGGWTKTLAQVSRAAMEAAGFEVWTDELQRTDPLTMPAPNVINAVREREIKLADAGERIHADVKATIEEAIQNGETMDQIRERVKTAFNGISSTRVDMIARTETTIAYETARDLTFRQAGVEWTKWLTMEDMGDRHPSYSGLHGQIRAIDEPFDLGNGVKMRFPGDPEGPPSEIINCRCIRTAVLGPDPTDIEGNNPDAAPY